MGGPAADRPTGTVDGCGYSDIAIGEHGAWSRHLALAWRAVADPRGRHAFPEQPRPVERPEKFAQIAWWGPLLHLLAYGLGWPRPDLGLHRWRVIHDPTDDDRLKVVHRWWGSALPEFIDWALVSQSMKNLSANIGQATGTRTVADPAEAFGISVPARHRWGTSADPMHLGYHADGPISPPAARGRLVVGEPTSTSRNGQAVLLVDGYNGWYAELHRLGSTLPVVPGHRSWRVDVVCRPLGWLGIYRLSSTSGRWFAGQHRWHQLGCP